MRSPDPDPDHWYEGTVDDVHRHYTWVKIKEKASKQIFTLEPGHRAVVLELTANRNKNVRVRFKLDTDCKVTEIMLATSSETERSG